MTPEIYLDYLVVSNRASAIGKSIRDICVEKREPLKATEKLLETLRLPRATPYNRILLHTIMHSDQNKSAIYIYYSKNGFQAF